MVSNGEVNGIFDLCCQKNILYSTFSVTEVTNQSEAESCNKVKQRSTVHENVIIQNVLGLKTKAYQNLSGNLLTTRVEPPSNKIESLINFTMQLVRNQNCRTKMNTIVLDVIRLFIAWTNLHSKNGEYHRRNKSFHYPHKWNTHAMRSGILASIENASRRREFMHRSLVV